MATIYIDNQPHDVDDGDNLLQACLELGLDLPYFCWHPAMGSIGACRQCAILQFKDEDDTQGRIVMGCMTPVTDGARISLDHDRAREFRSNIVESLMLNHPHDCPVCAEGGECHLQDMTVMVGHRDRRYRGRKNTHRNQYLGPLINHEMNRCIACYRCTRFYNDYAGGTDLAAQAAHDHVYFGRHEDGVLESEFAGNLVEVCPTGVFTDKPLVHEYTRKWDLQSAPSVCTGCGLGCNILPGERYGKLKRIHNRYNHDVNGYFLCDRGRYGGAFVNREDRLSFAGLKRDDGRFDAIGKDAAMAKLVDWCGPQKRLAAVGSPRATVETNAMLWRLVGAERFCSGLSAGDAALLGEIERQLRASPTATPTLKQIEAADAILILGEDVTNTAPRMALSLRQSVRNQAFELAAAMHLQSWQDAAIRTLAQNRRSPLFIASPAATRLDDVARQTVHLAPDDIARLGYAVAAGLGASLPELQGIDEPTGALVEEICAALRVAKQPLVVSGCGAQNTAVIQAAAAVNRALATDNQQAMLSYCVPECNSLGVAMLAGDGPALSDLAGEPIDTLIVAENDLYRRAPAAEVDALLNKVDRLVVIDMLDNPTASRADLVLPAASFAECEGTLVSNEGRAQRFYPVFPATEDQQAGWSWAAELGAALRRPEFDGLTDFDQAVSACAEIGALEHIVAAAPGGEFRNRGLKIPRQPHRYSGRTAMLADVSVHEPQQPEDGDTPLSYSMEGLNSDQPGALLPFVWAPGWNSNQSLHKFQHEIGGRLTGGTAGVRLIEPNGDAEPAASDIPGPFATDGDRLLLVPAYRIFGSDELSVKAPAIAELAPGPTLLLRSDDAEARGLSAGDTISVTQDGDDTELELALDDSLPAGCAAYIAGVSTDLCAGARVTIGQPGGGGD